MKKILVIVGHPSIHQKSHIHQHWLKALENNHLIDTHFLVDQELPFNVLEEQQRLTHYDRIVLQFPMHWYAFPALLKRWIDEILLHGFAYGPDYQLQNKEFILAFSQAGLKENYTPSGSNHFSTQEIIAPLLQTLNFCKIKLLSPFFIQGVYALSAEQIQESAQGYLQHILQKDLPVIDLNNRSTFSSIQAFL